MVIRNVVTIDEAKCNGCGECIPSCHEGALRIVDGKARLVGDVYCDGLGNCLGTCPQDAIRIVEREADPFDEEAVRQHLEQEGARPCTAAPQGPPSGCPGAMVMERDSACRATAPDRASDAAPSALTQWPIQLRLAPVDAPYLDGADLLLAADCAPFAYADFHRDLLAGRKLLIGCPKLDDGAFYRDKLTEILRRNSIRSLTVAHMEVPCCHGLLAIARSAVEASGSALDVKVRVLSVRGEVTS